MALGSVLITGATGFIGSHLVHRFAALGEEVHVFVRHTSSLSRIEDAIGPVTVWRGDLENCHSIRDCLQAARPAHVFHLAADTAVRWFDPDLANVDISIDINLKGTCNLLTELRRADIPVCNFVRAGGLEEYGRGHYPFSEEQRESPVSPYSASQVAATHYSRMLQPFLGFPVITIRPALVYGPGQSTGFFIPSIIEHFLAGHDFPMTAGKQRRDLVFVSDVIDAFIAAARTPGLTNEIINIGSGSGYRMRDVAAMARSIIGSEARPAIGALAERASEIQVLTCRNRKAQQLLSWTPQTSLFEGLVQTIQWYREHGTRMQLLEKK
jgi:UDP-glucose 4-epimerase